MPRVVDPEAERAAILDACFPLFARKGYAATTMRALARQAGMSTGKLYHYFPTKEALFEALVERASHRDIAAASAKLPPGAGPAERAAALADFVLGEEASLQALLLLVLERLRHDGSEEGRQLVRRLARRYREALATELRLPDPEMAAPILSLVLGLLVHRLLDAPGANAPAHRTLLQVLAGLQAGGPSTAAGRGKSG